MNRDMDTVRRIALAVADAPGPVSQVQDMAQPDFARHAQWMHEAGLVLAALLPKDSMKPAEQAIIWRLTWAGCDFADAVRSDTLWAQAKASVIKPSASWTFGILLDWLKERIGEQLGQLAP